jgi:hypothetical protein
MMPFCLFLEIGETKFHLVSPEAGSSFRSTDVWEGDRRNCGVSHYTSEI